MNKTKIEWTDYSFNPITGCKHDCWYCYAKKLFTRFHKSFEPIFYPERLKELDELKTNGNKIFVCSVADLFAEWTPEDWTKKVLEALNNYPKQEYQLLTKAPDRLNKFKIPSNCWVGVTCNNKEDYDKAMWYLPQVKCKVKFISFEPLLADVGRLEFLENINWIIIGKLTGSRKVMLENSWVENIIRQAKEKNIPIFIKNNVNWNKKIQEFPI
jgi:protein gp37